jgi:putative MATE family efflux protein
VTAAGPAPVDRRALRRQVATIALPALGALATEPLYILVDTAIVGHLGTAALGGLAVAGSVLSAISWISAFVTALTTTTVAVALGADEHADVGRPVVDALVVAIGLSIVAVAAVLSAGGWLTRSLGHEPDVAAQALTYLRISAVGVPALLITFVGHGLCRGQGRTSRSFAVVVVANVVNVVLEVILVYGFHTGIAGSAWGTVAAQWLGAAMLSRWLWAAIAGATDALAFRARAVGRLIADGTRFSTRTATLIAVFTTATALAAHQSRASLAAHQSAYQLFLFLALGLDALAVAGQVIVGRARGEGTAGSTRAVIAELWRITVAFGLILAVVVAALSPVVGALFTHDHRVRTLLGPVLLVLAGLQIPGAVAFTGDGILLGYSAYGWMQRSGFFALAAIAPVGLALAGAHLHTPVWLWLGLTGWMVVRAAVNVRGISVLGGAASVAPAD